jgi:hypothetical protein
MTENLVNGVVRHTNGQAAEGTLLDQCAVQNATSTGSQKSCGDAGCPPLRGVTARSATTVSDFLGFDPSLTPVIESFEGRKEPIPNGVYRAKVTSAERKPTKQCPNCWFWVLQFTIIAGEFEGRSLPIRFNIVNTNQQAEEIGRGQMSHYLHCIGNLSPQSEADLCGVPVVITVATRKSTFIGRNDEPVEGVTNEIVHVDSCGDQAEPMPW